MVVRVGVLGYSHEANALASPLRLVDALDVRSRVGGLAASWEAGPFIETLASLRPFELVALPTLEFGAGGPLIDADFREFMANLSREISAVGRLDAIGVLGHGAGTTTTATDPDGEYLALVRALVGDEVPIVAVFDLHANISAAMVGACDAIVGYRTNPHVDIHDRLREAAGILHRLLEGTRTVRAFAKAPIVLPQIAQLTTAGEPLGEIVELGQQHCLEPILNVSVFGGFALGDSPDCGLSIVVTASENGRQEAATLARLLVDQAWALRDRYRLHTTALPDAVEAAVRTANPLIPAVLLADVADNQGGGAPGNTTFVLRALYEAGVADVCMALHCDIALVNEAWGVGIGGEFEAVFNRGSSDVLAVPFSARATVLTLIDENFVPIRGVYKGAVRSPGRGCALQINGITVAVASNALQCADPDTMHHFGMAPESARVIVVKSRGHFRAGFDTMFESGQIIEVGVPGVATPVLATVPWRHLPRPVFPLDQISDEVMMNRSEVVLMPDLISTLNRVMQ